ncbi:MAG: FkbM family methyltransferase [Chitinophagaceae bacterium]
MRQTISFILNHPLTKHQKARTLARFFKWQLRALFTKKPYKHRFTDKTVLIVEKGMTGATGNLYCGLHDYMEMFFLLHFLRPGDLFGDIGANVGSYSILGAGHAKADVVAVEPSPSTFAKLTRNIEANGLTNCKAFNVALGDKKGEISFTNSRTDTLNRAATKEDTDLITVPMDTLDNILQGRPATILKVDVEGYEEHVLMGAKSTLANPALKAIMIEIGGASEHYGFNDGTIISTLRENGFESVLYDPAERRLYRDRPEDHKRMFVRDFDYVQEKLKSAPKVNILNNKI